MVIATLIAAADSWTASDGMDCTFCFLKDFLRLESSLYMLTEVTLCLHLYTFVAEGVSAHAEKSNATVKTGADYVNSAIMCLFRAFGSTGIILPLLLDKEKTLLTNLDFYVYLWIICILGTTLVRYLPNFYFWPMKDHTVGLLYWLGNTCNAIFECSCLVTGFNLAAEAFPDSLGCAFALSFLGVYGAHIVEKGFAGGFDDAYANEYILAGCGTVMYKALMDMGGLTAPMAQCTLVFLRVVQNRSDFRRLASFCLDAISKYRRDSLKKSR